MEIGREREVVKEVERKQAVVNKLKRLRKRYK